VSRPGGAAWRRWLGLLAVVLLLGPPLVLLAYRFVPPPGTPLMLKRLAQGHGLEREWVPLERARRHLARAVIASEDNLFCRHWGIDTAPYASRSGARWTGSAPGVPAPSPSRRPRTSCSGRARPGPQAAGGVARPQLELILGKRRILEIYLNSHRDRPRPLRREAAARRYFGKPAAKLTPREAALIASILPAPLRRSPASPAPTSRGAPVSSRPAWASSGRCSTARPERA
jgi:monofunctional biosynthetic peptidoglycan transglycosylase